MKPVTRTQSKRTNPAKRDRNAALKSDGAPPQTIQTGTQYVTAQPVAGNVPAEPLGPLTIANRIECALQPLALLEWALAAKLDDADEIETFHAPLLQAKRELRELCKKLYRDDAVRRAAGVA